MIKKTLVGLAIGYVLSAPTAFAEEYRGLYFGVWGGSGSVDLASKADFDEAVVDLLPDELDSAAFIDNNNTTTITTDDVLYEFALDALGRSSLDDSVSVWGLNLGYRWNRYFAAEIGYAKLGEASYRLPMSIEVTATDITTGASASDTFVGERAMQFTSAGPTISALGMLPLGERFDLHVRGGIYLADTRVTNRIRDIEFDNGNIAHRRVDASQTELFAGIGGAWNINENFVLRAEYQKFLDVGDDKKTGESDIDVFNVSVLFK
ncbi:MAG: outer membrane beta-barrel protein [Steroidobacter sp.]